MLYERTFVQVQSSCKHIPPLVRVLVRYVRHVCVTEAGAIIAPFLNITGVELDNLLDQLLAI